MRWIIGLLLLYICYMHSMFWVERQRLWGPWKTQFDQQLALAHQHLIESQNFLEMLSKQHYVTKDELEQFEAKYFLIRHR